MKQKQDGGELQIQGGVKEEEEEDCAVKEK